MLAFGAVTVAVLLSATLLVAFAGIAVAAVDERRHRHEHPSSSDSPCLPIDSCPPDRHEHPSYGQLADRARQLRADLDREALRRELNTVHAVVPFTPDTPPSLN